MPEVSVLVLAVLVARVEPLAQERPTRALRVVQIEERGRFSLELEVPDLSAGDFLPVRVDDTAFVSRDGLAAAPWADVPRPVRDEDMEILGGPDAVDELDPRAVEEVVPEGSGERLTCGRLPPEATSGRTPS